MTRRIRTSTSSVYTVSRMFAAAIVGLTSAGTYAQPPIMSFLADAPEGFIRPPLLSGGKTGQVRLWDTGVNIGHHVLLFHHEVVYTTIRHRNQRHEVQNHKSQQWRLREVKWRNTGSKTGPVR